MIDQEILHLLEHAFSHAVKLVRNHEIFIRRGVSVLLEKEVLDEQELKSLWEECKKSHSSDAEGLAPSLLM
jgi:ATP-dependent Zn protease